MSPSAGTTTHRFPSDWAWATLGLCAAWLYSTAAEELLRASAYRPFDPATVAVFDRSLLLWTGVGFLVVFLHFHEYRRRGFLPLAATTLFGLTLLSAATGGFGPWGSGLLGFTSGVVLGTGMTWALTACAGPSVRFRVILTMLLGGATVWATNAVGEAVRERYSPGDHERVSFIVLVLASGFLAVLGWWCHPRPLVELGIGVLVNRNYRIRGAGPGIDAFPTTGPVLVIANHASYLDPAFLGTVLPRPVTAMMTATFFDKPVIRPLMVHVFGTIRVSEDPIKRDASELREAIAALGDGKCLLIFPEGYLRRKDDVPLKRFGRGVWEVLKAHPDTPVVACWIEGAWGSYYSFKDGPPGENKVLSGRRPIGVGVSAPVPVPASVLADHLTTRLHLMNLVLGARTHLGLEELPPVELPKRGAAAGDAA
jgi:1-acyl-sn-glycerol-3-phosphate acyltransferase